MKKIVIRDGWIVYGMVFIVGLASGLSCTKRLPDDESERAIVKPSASQSTNIIQRDAVSMDDGQLYLVQDAKTGAEMWLFVSRYSDGGSSMAPVIPQSKH